MKQLHLADSRWPAQRSHLAEVFCLAIVAAFVIPATIAADAPRATNPTTADESAVPTASAPAALAPGVEEMDRERVRTLFRKQNTGKTLTAEEQAYLERAMGGMAKRPKAAPAPDRSKSAPTFRPIVSKDICAVIDVAVTAKDGAKPLALLRKPPGNGPFPAIVYFHGGSASFSRDQLEAELLGQTLSRFLAAGYAVVAGTYRPVRDIENAIIDGVAVVEQVKALPGIDPKSVVVWGDSAGGSLAFDIAAQISVCAVTAMEPATILFARVGSGSDRMASVLRPKTVYNTAAQDYTRSKIRKIEAPVFIAHGDIHPINNFNNEITIPEMRAENRKLEAKLYPGENHGFSRRSVSTLDGPKRFFEDTDAFFKRHVATQPRPLSQELFKEVAVDFDRGRSADREEK